MVKCTINGIDIEVEAGTSVIEAFKQAGQDIAHYCWHPGLSVAGVCRLCMVEIEGNPRLQIACNTQVAEGMKVTNQSEMVKDAVKWGLDFHLINHPLDCPICDQAGECGLQDQYMHFGKYDPEMALSKVKKHKVVDLGERVVLDSERCILCSRCVRFTEEVSKSNELGIFNRGDRSEIGTFDGMPLNNKYSVNTVDICPVGALTSKDFRFRQRVWFLKDKPSVCTGCSTGCNIDVYFNKDGVWRVKPHHSDVNGYWMCDEGRDIYKAVNPITTDFVGERENKKAVKKPNRILSAHSYHDGKMEFISTAETVSSIELGSFSNPALIVTGQYSNEEYDSILGFWKSKAGGKNIFHWQNQPEQWQDFDGLLIRGDKNPNTKGLLASLEKHGLQAQSQLPSMEGFDFVLVLGPENQWVYDNISQVADQVSQAKKVIWLSACHLEKASQMPKHVTFVPAKTFVEKSGSFTNFEGKVQSFAMVDVFVEEALDLQQVTQWFAGERVTASLAHPWQSVHNEFIHERGEL
ncbi:MAG: (2Fe-2S)-binding protein [Bdellovibrionales bacterium]|nr:(2Fe-2S)-binding protein [Bdellovibrionales bacterium]